jgi:hypothetical protein
LAFFAPAAALPVPINVGLIQGPGGLEISFGMNTVSMKVTGNQKHVRKVECQLAVLLSLTTKTAQHSVSGCCLQVLDAVILIHVGSSSLLSHALHMLASLPDGNQIPAAVGYAAG